MENNKLHNLDWLYATMDQYLLLESGSSDSGNFLE